MLAGVRGGHKGVESIISRTGSPEFIRIRIGIGRPPRREDTEQGEKDVIAYVLSDFTPEERSIIDHTVLRVSDAIRCLLSEGLEKAMNRYNSLRSSESSQKVPDGEEKLVS